MRLAILLVLSTIVSTCAGTVTKDPCREVDCGTHGQCTMDDGVVACTCDTGYHAEGLTCAVETNANANLSSLAISSGTLMPSFDPSVTSYTATVENAGVSATVTATAAASGASITVQEVSVVSGTPSAAITLRASTTIVVEVTAPDGTTKKNYSVIVNLSGWHINGTNTGLAGVGVDKNSLPDYTGANPIPAGSTITLQKLVDPDLTAGNITIDRCWIVETVNPTTVTGSDNGPIIIQDSNIEGVGPASTVGFIAAIHSFPSNQPTSILRTDISGVGGGFWMNGPGTIKHCYIHELPEYGDPATNGNHIDGGTRKGDGDAFGQLDIVDNNIDIRSATHNASAAIFLQSLWGGNFDNVLCQGNLLGGGGWVVYLEASADVGTYGDHIYMVDNRWYPNPIFGYAAVVRGPGFGQWTDNFVNDPDHPGNKGAVLNEP